MSTGTFTLQNRLGLHARAAARLASVLNEASGDVWVDYSGRRVNGKSILGLLMLAAPMGSELDIEVSGENAAAVLEAVSVLIENRFGEAE
ncbi:MAG: HPr family phosphocarrier protein [Myxococcota bacterium]|nr:HPr family phosphocarrier protein [Myxococcota bacterium]